MPKFAASALLLASLGVSLPTSNAFATEVCRFAGQTNHAGQVAVTSRVAASDGVTKVDVALTFDSTTLLWLHVHYLVEEVSFWRGSELDSVAVNTRYLFAGHVVRQQWDQFQRAPDGLEAHRVQAKTLVDFRRMHPGFISHWDPAMFARPWLDDYPAAAPERRADLDLKGTPLPSPLRSPLAMAFYWVRWLPKTGQDVAVFLPGFKKDRLLRLPIAGVATAGGMLWRAPVEYPLLSRQQASTAMAHTTPDGHLLQLAFDLHDPRGSAKGQIDQLGCDGPPVIPDRR